MFVEERYKILFQGDSITDAGRNYQEDIWMGCGYPVMVAGRLGYEHPGKYSCINKGISGNRVVDLYARWKADCLNLKPDVISILIGVNDVWHEVSYQNGVDVDKYERMYDMLLTETREVLPNVKLMILEPFVLKGPATTEAWDIFQTEVSKRSDAARRIAQKHNAIFVPLQKAFDEVCKNTPVTDWLMDGVHPTAAGHALITDQWLKAFTGSMD